MLFSFFFVFSYKSLQTRSLHSNKCMEWFLWLCRLLDKVKSCDVTWKANGTAFIVSITKLLERLLDYRNVMEGEENRDKRMSCTFNLLVNMQWIWSVQVPQPWLIFTCWIIFYTFHPKIKPVYFYVQFFFPKPIFHRFFYIEFTFLLIFE